MSTSSEVLPTAPPAALREIDDLPHPPGLPWLGNTLQIDKPHVHQQVEFIPELVVRASSRRPVARARRAGRG